MYRCTVCRTEVKTAGIFDPYDNDTYKVCANCGGDVEKSEIFCEKCGSGLFDGDRAFEVSDKIYCTDCVEPVIV